MGDCFYKSFQALKQHDDEREDRILMRQKFFYNLVMIQFVSLISQDILKWHLKY